MSKVKNGSEEDRRADVRLASYKKIEAAVVDDHGQPIVVLRDAEVINVSAGGLLLVSDTPAEPGTRMTVKSGAGRSSDDGGAEIDLVSLECKPWREDQHRIRCKLADGHMPAQFIYGW